MVKEVLDEHRLPDDFANKLIHGLETARWWPRCAPWARTRATST